MIARTIYETINFERGLDPKNAMGIGVITFKTIREGDIIQYIKENQYMPSKIKLGDFAIITNVEQGKKSLFLRAAWYNTLESAIYYKKNPNSSNKNKIAHYWSNYIGGGKFYYYQWNDFFRIIQRDELHESQHFERGLDPKAAMNVGKEALDKKLIEETDWAIGFSTRDEYIPYDIIEVIHDYKGLPILIIQNKSHKDWPYRAISIRGAYTGYCKNIKEALKEIQHEIDKAILHYDFVQQAYEAGFIIHESLYKNAKVKKL